jgi:hypothetical protein
LREEVTLLANGQLPFPTVILNALNQQLPANGRAGNGEFAKKPRGAAAKHKKRK